MTTFVQNIRTNQIGEMLRVKPDGNVLVRYPVQGDENVDFIFEQVPIGDLVEWDERPLAARVYDKDIRAI